MKAQSKADRVWREKERKQRRYTRLVKGLLNRAERALGTVYTLEMDVLESPTIRRALTTRAQQSLALARYHLMNVRNR